MRLMLELIADRRLTFAALGSLGIVVGSFLPWAHVSTFVVELDERGIESGGKITFVLGALALALVGAHALTRHVDLAGGAGLSALGCLAIAVQHHLTLLEAGARIAGRLGVPQVFTARAGAGLFAVEAGAAVTVVASAVLFASARRARAGSPAGER